MKLFLLLSLCAQSMGFHASPLKKYTTIGEASKNRSMWKPLQARHIQEDISCFYTESAQFGVTFKQKLTVGLLYAASILVSLGISDPAFADTSVAVTVLNHEYLDPLHPQCRRTIQVNADGKTFHYSGTSVGLKDDPVLRGCTPGEIKKYGLRTGSFDGQIQMPGLRLSAGDGIHEGQWEPANSATNPSFQFKAVDGIRWNDGNKWIVKEESPKPLSKLVGEWIFLAYIGFSTLAGVKGVVDKIQEKRSRAAN